MEEIDYREYVTPTRFSNPMGIVLAIQLLRAAVASSSEAVRAALERMRDAAVHAQSLAADRLRAAPEKLRPIDIRLDGGIVGLREVLEGKARLVGTDVGAAASRLLAHIFPNGTSFVLLSHKEQWVAVQSHLARIEQDGLTDEIARVAGPEFLPFIREAHAALGEGLGLGETALTPPDTATLRDANTRLAKAIATYGRAMVGTVNEEDAESLAAFRRAMYPLDAYRRATFRREPILDTDISPTDPIPPVPVA